MALTPTPEAAVFDLDGTLVLSEGRNRAIWSAFFTAHGIPVDEDLLVRVTGRRGLDSLAELAHLFPGRTVEQLYAQVCELESRLDLPPIVPTPGAAELVRQIGRTGTPLGLVTSATRGYAEACLDDVGVRELFSVVVTAEDVGRGKPDPEGYLLACARLGVDPTHAVGFEDAPAGVAAVKAAGMRCVGVTTSQPARSLSEADAVVADLTQVTWPPRLAA